MIVLHYTGMHSAGAALQRMCDPAAKVSAHYLIDEAGTVTQMIDEADRAWHAGVACWHGETDINSMSVGIELQNPGHEHGYRPFPDAQIRALSALMTGIRSRHDVPDHRIVGHSDVAPSRKQDPGELFPWQRLSAEGHGTWPLPGGPVQRIDDARTALARIGYATDANDLPQVITAFQRRFLPTHLTGKADADTISRIGEVLTVLG